MARTPAVLPTLHRADHPHPLAVVGALLRVVFSSVQKSQKTAFSFRGTWSRGADPPSEQLLQAQRMVLEYFDHSPTQQPTSSYGFAGRGAREEEAQRLGAGGTCLEAAPTKTDVQLGQVALTWTRQGEAPPHPCMASFLVAVAAGDSSASPLATRNYSFVYFAV